jgi:hypothetical protein
MRPSAIAAVGAVVTFAMGWSCAGTNQGANRDGAATGAGGGGATAGAGAGANGGGAASGGGGSSGGIIDAGNPEAVCGQMTYATQLVPAEVLILLDKSTTMMHDFNDNDCSLTPNPCTGPSKWDAITDAIKQVAAATDTTVAWGLKFFPDDPVCGANGRVDVDVGPNNAAAIAAAIDRTTPLGATPTRAIVTTGGSYLRSRNDSNPKYILLATDGEPNCTVGFLNATDPDDPAAEQAVLNVAGSGIPVFVIGVGNVSTAQDALNVLATNGGQAQLPDAMGRVYYPTDDPAAIIPVLSAISLHVASCNLALVSVPPAPDNIDVLADGRLVLQDTSHTDGWDYGPGLTSIVLYGSTCEMYMSGGIANIETIFGCEGKPIIVP